MLARTRENLQSIYVLIFLNVAFFLFQYQDQERYRYLFSFDRSRVLSGELWRIFTYQFVQSGPLSLFFVLLILYIMGSAVEATLGTFDFMALFLLSLFGSVAIAFGLNIALLGSFFISYSLLFVYAYLFPEQTFYVFFVLPVKVKWLAWIAVGVLIVGIVIGNKQSIAAAGGVILSFGYFLLRNRRPALPKALRPDLPKKGLDEEQLVVHRNLVLYQKIKKALGPGTAEERAALAASILPTIKAGVNICPPRDFKPEHEDRYCARCEGFAECSVRHMRLSDPALAEGETHS
ncbi:MAG TPA: rhomboid family intramembrane serine protease [Thermoanaerobaculia bacterium]|nr:rhomboid family intramembrane serine protease [Thermoanaerobaculia bacterium]